MAVFKTTTTKGAFPDSQFISAREAIPEAIALNPLVATQSVVISGDAPRVNVPYVSVDPTANVVAEGAEIATSNPALNQISFGTHKIALLVPFSNESLMYPDAVNLVTDSATKALVAQADHLFRHVPDQRHIAFADRIEIADRQFHTDAASCQPERAGISADVISLDVRQPVAQFQGDDRVY